MVTIKIIATASCFFLGIKKNDILDIYQTDNNLDKIGTLARLWSQAHPSISFDAVIDGTSIVSIKCKGRPTNKYVSISQVKLNSKAGI